MLEQAHERQFAISQIGLFSAGFELEHTARIKHTLETLLDYFTNHQSIQSPQRPTSPYREHLADFSLSKLPTTFEPLPPIDPEQPITALSATDTPSRSPLALVDLMNPEPSNSRPSKRKYSATYSPPSVDVDSPENILDIGNESLYLSALDYVRASQSHTPTMTRTHREARMRRPSPIRKAFSHHRIPNAYDADQAETEAHLLLSFSQHFAKVGG